MKNTVENNSRIIAMQISRSINIHSRQADETDKLLFSSAFPSAVAILLKDFIRAQLNFIISEKESTKPHKFNEKKIRNKNKDVVPGENNRIVLRVIRNEMEIIGKT